MDRFFSIFGKTILVLVTPILLVIIGYYIGTYKNLIKNPQAVKTDLPKPVEAKTITPPTVTPTNTIIPSTVTPKQVATPDAKLLVSPTSEKQ